jgi:hypothetical protein
VTELADPSVALAAEPTPAFTMTITHLFQGTDGMSHYEDMELTMPAVDFAPPAPLANVSKPYEARRAILLALPPGWHGEMHPAPSRQLMTLISGRLEVTASDGESRVFVPGDTALVEDTTGPGHATRNLLNGYTILTVTQL